MITRDQILDSIGLQSRRSATDFLLPALGVFGAGMLLGAGLGMMFAPKRGSELRHDIGERASKLASRVRREKQELAEERLDFDVKETSSAPTRKTNARTSTPSSAG